jgi:hypothetical protein
VKRSYVRSMYHDGIYSEGQMGLHTLHFYVIVYIRTYKNIQELATDYILLVIVHGDLPEV